MNIERLNILAEYLERPHIPYDFNMRDWLSLAGTEEDNWCGTRCCIAGLTVLLFSEPNPNSTTSMQAEQLLGLDGDEAGRLFIPDTDRSYNDLSRAEAATAVRNVIAGDPYPWAFA